jgi:hypothetical protein
MHTLITLAALGLHGEKGIKSGDAIDLVTRHAKPLGYAVLNGWRKVSHHLLRLLQNRYQSPVQPPMDGAYFVNLIQHFRSYILRHPVPVHRLSQAHDLLLNNGFLQGFSAL